jgi:hypothetical protein
VTLSGKKFLQSAEILTSISPSSSAAYSYLSLSLSFFLSFSLSLSLSLPFPLYLSVYPSLSSIETCTRRFFVTPCIAALRLARSVEIFAARKVRAQSITSLLELALAVLESEEGKPWKDKTISESVKMESHNLHDRRIGSALRDLSGIL